MYGSLKWNEIVERYAGLIVYPGVTLDQLLLVSNAPLYSYAAIQLATGTLSEGDTAIFDVKLGETGQGWTGTASMSRSMTNVRWNAGQPTDNQMYIGLAAGFAIYGTSASTGFTLLRSSIGRDDLKCLGEVLSWLIEDPNGRTTTMGDLMHWPLPGMYRGACTPESPGSAAAGICPSQIRGNGGECRELGQPIVWRPNTSTRIKIRVGAGGAAPVYLADPFEANEVVVIQGVIQGFLVTRPN